MDPQPSTSSSADGFVKEKPKYFLKESEKALFFGIKINQNNQVIVYSTRSRENYLLFESEEFFQITKHRTFLYDLPFKLINGRKNGQKIITVTNTFDFEYSFNPSGAKKIEVRFNLLIRVIVNKFLVTKIFG